MIKIMGIQNYLKRVSKATKDIKSAIEEKGVPVAMCDGYEQLADKVRAIQVGSSVEASDMLFTMLAFKQSTSMPGTPTGGSFSETKITYPSGWSDGAGLTENVWMSYCVIKGDGSVYKNWVTPIKLSGISASDIPSVDLTDYALKSWVTEQISKIQTGGQIDLSAYATKAYVDSGDASTLSSSKKYTDDEIAKIQTGGSVDLSNYATKSYVDDRDANVLTTAQGYWELGDDETLKSAKAYADALVSGAGVSSLNSMTGDITLMGSDSVSISRSGKSLIFTASGGSGGGDGKDGDTIRSFNIYKNTDSNTDIPEIPVNSAKMPYWNYSTGELDNCPTGWATDMVNDPTKYTWMAVGFFSKNSAGAQVGTWEGPLCITGEPGKPGEDGASMEFIYALTPDADKKPNYPTTAADLKKLFNDAENNNSTVYNGQRWYDRAQSIDPTTNRACWMAQRVKYAGAEDWNIYSSTPVIWANWGSDGTDGDGVEYIFFLTDDAHQSAGKWYSDAENFAISYTEPGTVNGVETAYDNTVDDWVPKGWTDEPQDVSETDGFYEFCAIRKSTNGVWGEFSTPSLWAKYAMDGKDGASVEYVFATCSEDLKPEQVSVDNVAANRNGASTTDEYLPNFNFNGTVVKATDDPVSVSETVPYQWVSMRRRKRGESIWQDFSNPSLWNMWAKGSEGPRGMDGDTIEEVYALTDVVVSAPYPMVDDSAEYDGKTSSDEGYLPKFNFSASVAEQTVATRPSISETKPYLYGSRRRLHNGEFLGWDKPYLVSIWTYAGLQEGDLDKIKEEVGQKVSSDLSLAKEKAETVENRLNQIQGTDGKFTVDATKGIVSAITSYVAEDGEKHYADLIADAASGTITAQVGAQMEKLLTGVGIDMEVLNATLTQWAVFKDGDENTTGTLNFVYSKINAAEANATTAALSATKEEISSARTEWDAKNAELTSDVSKCKYVWVKRSDTDTIPGTNPVIYKIIEDTPYDYTGKDEAGKDQTIEKYDEAMEAKGWEKVLLAQELSQIRQTPGEIDLTAAIDKQIAGIKIEAKDPVTGKSTIKMSSDLVNFSGTITAPDAIFKEIGVVDGNITNGTITNAEISNCVISSQIKSKVYTPHNDSSKTNGVGFLFDAGSAETEDFKFAIYSGDGGRITKDEIVVPKVESTNFTSEGTDKQGFSLNALDSDGSFAFYGQTAGGEKFELTNNSLVIPSAVIGDVTVDTVTSKEFTSATDSNAGKGFSLQGDTGKFEFYGDKSEDGEVAFTLTNSKLEIPAAYIKNLTTGDIDKFEEGVWRAVNTSSIELAKNISSVIADQADFYVKTLNTKDSMYRRLYIGADAVTTETSSVTYTDGYDSGEVHFGETSFWEPTIPVGNAISAKAGQTLKIPSIHWNAWGWFAYTMNRSSKNELVRLFLVKKSGSSWSNVQTLYTWNETWGASGTHNSDDEDGRYTGSTTYNVTSDGEYALQFRISLEHPGNNLKGYSKLRFSHNMYTLKAISEVGEDTGITINPTTFVARCGSSIRDDSIKEASLSIGSSGISSTGFVLSNTVTGIKTVDKADDCDDQNTLYIILK